MTKYSNLTALGGRFLLASLFLMSGIGKIAAPVMTQGFIASVGVPMPLAAYIGSVAIEVGGSLLLLFGYRTRGVAAALAVFSVLTAIFFHRNFVDQNQMIHFLKNIAIAGGLLQVMAFGGGAYSLDARRRSATPYGLSAAAQQA